MIDVVPQLTEDEAACLMIMKDGQAIVDIGEFSKWHGPLLSLARRGLCAAAQKFNNGYEYVITDTGRQVCESWEDQSLRDVIEANNKVAASRHKYLTPNEVTETRVYGLSPKQIAALASFYTNATGKKASEICTP